MSSKYKTSQPVTPVEIFRLKPLLACLRLALAGGVFCGALSDAKAEGALPVPAQNWVTGGRATNRVVGDALHIDQQSERAVLNWKSFNVGERNAVNFQQPSPSSIAMNRIGQNDPSKIFGKITANGQVYLYNQNGFLFGKDSVVNVNTLVATALNVSDDVILNGSIVTEYDTNNQKAAFSGRPKDDAAIQVETGANIKVDENGRLILVAPTINNDGSLEADKYGQIILVASKDRVYLQPANPDSPFAGLLVEVDTGGRVSNRGDILARQGNVTLAGFAVNQEGRVNATTSVNVNGSIRLLAREGEALDGDALVATRTTRNRDLNDGLGRQSKVTFGTGSVTEIVPDAEGGTAIDEQAQPLSYKEVMAHTIHLQSDAKISVPGGRVNMVATGAPMDPPQNKQGRLIMEGGASIDVSGNKGITASVERNVVEMSVQSFELRDSPQQKGGVLQGQTVKVDIREENPIVDISGALARVERSIYERLGKAGTVNLTAGGDVIVNTNAKIDISGGLITYEEGYIDTTRLITDYGKIVEIGQANPDERYTQIYGLYTETSPKWGVSRNWQVGGGGRGRFEPGYQEGLAAGELKIETAKLSWNGDLVAGSVSGFYQRGLGKLAYGGSLHIDTKTFSLEQGALNAAQGVLVGIHGSGLDILADQGFPSTEEGVPAELVLSTKMIASSGITDLTVKSLGQGMLAEDASLKLAPGGKFNWVANGVDIAGDIYIPSGNVNMSSGYDPAAAEASQVVFNGLATLAVRSGARLDVSGRWVNDFALGLSATPMETLAIAGGKISLAATADVTTEPNSQLLADGGAWYTQNEQLTAGAGGEIGLRTVGGAGASTMLNMQGSVSAYGLFKGGSLNLGSGQVVVGDADVAGLETEALVFDFNQLAMDMPSINGFGNFHLDSNFGDLVVNAQAAISPIQNNFILSDGFRAQNSSESIRGFSDVRVLPEHLRQPANLTFRAENDINVESGSQILADKGANVSLLASIGSIYVDGLISAPAGTINLTINDSPNPYDPTQSIWLGQNARLLSQGSTRLNPTDGSGRRTGDVLDGGAVNLTARRGYVVLASGSEIDVSGTKANLDLLAMNSGAIQIATTEIGSNAGKIQIVAAEGAVLDGNLTAKAGNSTTLAGNFDLSLDRTMRNPPAEIIDAFPFNKLSISVRQDHGQVLQDGVFPGANLDSLGLVGQAVVSADKLAQGGFSAVRFATANVTQAGTLSDDGAVDFVGHVDLTTNYKIDIDAPTIGWRRSDDGLPAEVNLNTAFFRAGSTVLRGSDQAAEKGDAVFTANAKWMQLEGGSRWDGFDTVNLISEHDLRAVGVVFVDRAVDGQQRTDFQGKLTTAANLNLQASQLYPSTLSKFTFSITNNPEGKLSIAGNGTGANNPLSAAGSLTFQAPIIEQNGVVKAPFGTINLAAEKNLILGEGSLTSVSGAGQLIPFGQTYNRRDWLYPVESNNILVFDTPPEKKLVLSGAEIDLQQGSVVDLSGGGDLLAYEFQPGIGGSFDYLAPDSPSYNGGFAIVPGLGSSWAPYDHLQRDHYSALGSQIYLSGTAGLSAGHYTILPPRYALLPGAFLVTPVANSQDQREVTRNAAGLPVIPGYRSLAGTGEVRESRWHGFLIENGQQLRKHSQYDEPTANSFYTQRAIHKDIAVPYLPKDSGQISIQNAQTKLSLEGKIITAAPEGRGARMDISAHQLKVVRELSATRTPGVLEILADDLTGLLVDSLLLGGERGINPTTGATEFTITSQAVTFARDAHVKVADLVAAATDKVTVQTGAKLEASGTAKTGDFRYELVGDGALLRVSADDQVVFNRSSDKGERGQLVVETGATLLSSNSILLDASQATTLAGDIQMQGGSLNLSANAINMGDVDGLSVDALNLSNEKLLNLAVDELILNSRNGIHLYGNIGAVLPSGEVSPLVFERLVLNSAGLAGFGEANESANIQAKTLELSNTQDSVFVHKGDGQALLNLTATDFQLAQGDFAINGFSAVNVSTDKGFVATADAGLSVGSDLNLASGYLTATGGSSLAINAQGHRVQITKKGDVMPAAVSYGGSIDMVADSINLNAVVSLPSGRLGLRSLKSDIVVGADANIDLSGDAVRFADIKSYTPGGVFSALADRGQITLAPGSKLDLSPGGEAAAGGKMIFQATQKSVELLGEIRATAGSVSYDVANYSNQANFDTLAKQFADAGVSDSVYIRVRNAGIEQTDSDLKANTITLVSDQSAISLAGKLNADGGLPSAIKGNAGGGSISLYAGDGIVLKQGAEITARGTGDGAEGGKVLLSSTDADNDQTSGIEVKAGAVIDVKAGNQGEDGSVLFRALRTDGNNDGTDDGVAILPIEGEVKNDGQFVAEGVKKYGNSALGDDGRIDLADISRFKADADSYMAAETIRRVGDLGGGVVLRPGIEINYDGDLALAEKWDLVDWRYANPVADDAIPGGLSINASGQLTFQQSLTDGFRTQSLVPGSPVRDILQTDKSWSYQLAAGADLTSADKTAVAGGGKALTIDPQALVRTGTGDIQISTSGDLVFKAEDSAVYVAGKAEQGSPYGSLGNIYVAFQFYGEYPSVGGDLSINVAGDIQGALSQSPFVNDWYVRQGRWQERVPTAWAINYANIEQNVGSFGGGNVSISAGGNINDLAVMMPTVGKQVGRLSDPDNQFSRFETNVVDIQDAGRLDVSAGGDIAGGVYFLGSNLGNIQSSGSITGSSNPLLFSDTVQGLVEGPQFLMGDTRFLVSARNNVSISAVSDPMILHDANVNFFSYTRDSEFQIKSLSGDVTINSDASVINSTYRPTTGQISLSKIYPASLDISAFGGDVLVGGTDTDIVMYPSARGGLNLFAEGDIAASTLGIKRLGMSDYDPALLPGYQQPFSAPELQSDANNIVAFLNPFSTDSSVYALTPVHRGNPTPARIASRIGDIRSLVIHLPKKAIVQSGRDFSNLSLNIQHANLSGDDSIISAGRDIIYPTNRLRDFGTLEGNTNKIEIGGSGNLLLKSGRDIDLGTSIGVSTVGNTYNPNLPSEGANLTALVGLNGMEPDFLGLRNLDQEVLRYAENYYAYQLLVTDFMRNRTGNTSLTVRAAFTQFHSLDPSAIESLQPALAAIKSDQYHNLLRRIENVIVNFVREKQGSDLTREQALEIFKGLDANQYLSIQPRLNTLANRMLFSIQNTTGSSIATDQDDASRSKAVSALNERLGRSVDYSIGNGTNFAPLQVGNEAGFAAINALYPVDRVYKLIGSDLATLVSILAVPETFGQVGQELTRFVENWKTINPGINDANVAGEFFKLTPSGYLAIKDGIAQSQQDIKPRYFADKPINPIYLGHEWNGDLSLFFSKLQTLRGGSINMLVPSGEINAGLAVVSEDLRKSSADLGIVVQGKGEVNAFLNNDFIVNQSRVFALSGGDIMIWSSVGDIDAGRGAKSAIAAPPPIISFDQSGNLVITFPPITSGSGIRTAAPIGGDILPGDVGLFAPGGVVNAGEAGIGGHNVTIAATAVLGANNIQVGGVGTGVPVAAAGSLAAGLTGVSNLAAGVVEAAESTLTDVARDKDEGAAKTMKLGTLTVDLIGFGSGTGVKEND